MLANSSICILKLLSYTVNPLADILGTARALLLDFFYNYSINKASLFLCCGINGVIEGTTNLKIRYFFARLSCWVLEILLDTRCVHTDTVWRTVAGDVNLVRCAFCRSRESELLKDLLLFLWMDSCHALSCLKFYEENFTLLYILIFLRCTQFIVL